MSKTNKITIKEALKQGYEYYFLEDSTMEIVHDIREEAEDDLGQGSVLIVAEKSDYMILDPQNIFENACEELHEGAFDNVYGSEEYKLFEKVCEYVSKKLRGQTQSYRETDIQIV